MPSKMSRTFGSSGDWRLSGDVRITSALALKSGAPTAVARSNIVTSGSGGSQVLLALAMIYFGRKNTIGLGHGLSTPGLYNARKPLMPRGGSSPRFAKYCWAIKLLGQPTNLGVGVRISSGAPSYWCSEHTFGAPGISLFGVQYHSGAHFGCRVQSVSGGRLSPALSLALAL
jgi:hypothetical protein